MISIIAAAAITAALTLAALSSQAAEVLVHVGSKHGHTTAVQFNNSNLGVSYLADNGVVVGAYHNSYRNTTVYAGYVYEPLVVGNIKVGALAALGTGYRVQSGLVVTPMAAATVSVNFGGYGVRVLYMPAVGRGAVDVQHLMLSKGF